MDKPTNDTAKKEKKNGGVIESVRSGLSHSLDAARAKRESPLMDLLTFLVSFIFSRCHVIFGSHPLAIGFIAVLPTRVWLAVLGAVTGSLSLGRSGIVYAMISVIVVFLRIVVSGSEKGEDGEGRVYLKLFSENLLLKMSTSVIAGFIAAIYEVLLSGITLISVLFGASMVLIPPLVTFALSGLFECNISLRHIFDSSANVFTRKGKSDIESFNLIFFRCSAMLLLFLISISLGGYSLLGISPAYIFAAAATLIVSRRFGAIWGCGVGFVTSFGISSSLSVAFALCGIAAGGMYRLSLLYGVAGGGAALTAWSLYSEGLLGVLSTLPEFAIASLCIYPLLKKLSAERTEQESTETAKSAQDMVGTVALSYRNRYKGDLSRLEMSLSAISDSIREYNKNSTRPTHEELYDLILECAEKYCKRCDGYTVCMSKESRPFIDAAKELALLLEKNGMLSEEDVRSHPEYCKLSGGVVEAVNRGYAILTEEKFKEARRDTSSEDFAIISKLINEARLADDREKAMNDELSGRLSEVMSDAGLDDGIIRAFGERRPYFILAGEDESGSRISAPELKKNIESIAGVRLGTPEYYRRGTMALMECGTEKSYSVECAVAQIAGERDEISGDTAAAFESENGYFYSLISDGMGSGREAKETSGFVTDFISRALEFGSEGQTVLKLLNHTVGRRHRECSATVDLFSVDLYRGDAEFIKSGAAPSYVKRGSSIFRIKSKTAPIGLMRGVDAERIHVDLEGDDYIIMLSDGIAQSAEDTPWLLDLLSREPKRNLKEYADHILSASLKHLTRTDDMTVLVTHVMRVK